jgi:hypothetical protein
MKRETTFVINSFGQDDTKLVRGDKNIGYYDKQGELFALDAEGNAVNIGSIDHSSQAIAKIDEWLSSQK